MEIPQAYLHPKWRDMSDWVVHFTDEAALVAILNGGVVNPSGPFGWGRKVREMQDSHRSACLSEIPLDHLGRLCDRHGRWGLGFSKTFVDASGGTRVWYLEAGSDIGRHLFASIGDLLRAGDFDSPLWRLTPFIDGMADDNPFTYRFDWEREWRVPGGLAFSRDDVAFLMTPNGTVPVGVHPDWAGVPVLPSSTVAKFTAAAPAMLGDDIDRLVEDFLKSFVNPLEELPWDSEEGDYFWPVRKWSTEDAIANLFDHLGDQQLLELATELNDLSTDWASADELAKVHE